MNNVHSLDGKVYWGGQSLPVKVTFSDASSSACGVLELALQAFHICLEYHISLDVKWDPEGPNETADSISKFIDFDDYALSDVTFQEINSFWGPHTVDRFACNWSTCPSFSDYLSKEKPSISFSVPDRFVLTLSLFVWISVILGFIVIKVQKSKNNQVHWGDEVTCSKRSSCKCPVKLLKRYLSTFNISPDSRDLIFRPISRG